MPTGFPYFAWIDASETTFGSEHMRWDEQVFSFTLSQEEGDPASLTAKVRRPSGGLLAPGRKIWAWFALDCGPGLVKFRGRLVGIPTSIFEELVTLEFVARPVDIVTQKQALAETLKVLPFYDEAVIDKERRNDPDVVLEGYTKVWHYDRETHVLTVSDEISGEDGVVNFDCGTEGGQTLYDGLGLTLTSGPLSRVDVAAEYTWTQQARGTVDLTRYLVSHWPGSYQGIIPMLNAGDWPKHGAGLGDGWEVEESSAEDLHDYTVKSFTASPSLTVEWPDGDSARLQINESVSYVGGAPPSNYANGAMITGDTWSVSYSKDGDGAEYVSSYNRSTQYLRDQIMVQEIKPTLVAGYKAERQCTEKVTFTLFADVQPILTDPEDGEALRLDGIRSVNLSEELIIGDPRRRSYIATERGNQSLEYLIAYARAHLMKRARVVEIAFVPRLERMPEITLRKSAFLTQPRIGEALGKIISYSISLDGDDGRINCEVKIGCAIGYGGLITASAGEPTYATADYVGADYQRFTDRTILVDAFTDSSVGYQPPGADPNDDGIDFLGGLTAEDVIEVPLTVEHGPDPEEDIEPPTNSGSSADFNDPLGNLTKARAEWYKNEILPRYKTRAKFKLKSMTRDFTSDYELQVTDLMVPTGIDLEAV